MEKIIFYIVFLFFLTSCSSKYSPEISKALDDFDYSLSIRKDIEKCKEAQIDSIKANLGSYTSNEEKYQRIKDVYESYRRYDADSSRFYAELKWNLAEQNQLDSLSIDAAMDIITLNSISGYYTDAIIQLREIDTTQLKHQQLVKFYGTSINFYQSMWLAQKNEIQKQKHYNSLKTARQRFINKADTNIIWSLIAKVELEYQSTGDSAKYMNQMVERLNNDTKLDYNEKSILAYLISNAYKYMGNEEKSFLYLIKSAELDINAPVREHKPLYDLAEKLYGFGDIERAYKYIDLGMADLFKTKVKVQMEYVERLFPSILKAYNQKRETDQRNLSLFTIAIVCILILLFSSYITVVKEKHKTNKARLTALKINEELNKTNEKLNEMNKMILAADNVKDIYIAQYLNMSLSYLNRVDKFRNMLLNAAHTKGLKEIIDILKSPTAINNELAFFYINFDKAFLHLFPNFVEEFNNLLQEDARFEIGKDKPLNTELRVFALIRLGITDSYKIAEFLRRSVSTVYNYRVKMRNAALNDREDFENQVKNIGLFH